MVVEPVRIQVEYVRPGDVLGIMPFLYPHLGGWQEPSRRVRVLDVDGYKMTVEDMDTGEQETTTARRGQVAWLLSTGRI